MICQQAAQVHAYYDGELPRDQRAALEAHLQQCGECRDLLDELGQMSELIASAPLAEPSQMTLARLEQSWSAVRDRGVMRIAGWLTAVAASVLVASLLFWKQHADESTVLVATTPAWVTTAVMPPAEAQHDDAAPSDLVVVAQWMANDLSGDAVPIK
jgi:predicted anti-sigma-YlaC factor YlaD